MKTKSVLPLALGIFLSAPLFASSIVQVKPVSFSGSGIGTGYVTPDILVTDILPFDSSLGTLTSFGFDWALTFTGSATNDEEGYGVVRGQVDGAFFVSNLIWGGNGGSGSDSREDPGPLSFSFDLGGDGLFQVAEAGSAYDESLLNLVTGTNAYPADWASYRITTPAHDIPWTGAVNGNFTVTYNYDAVESAAPEPSTFALMGTVLIGGFALLRRRRA